MIPCELEEYKITKANSPVITPKVVKTTKEAGKTTDGKDYESCVVYCLLVCKRWFNRQAALELWDADLHDARATACEVLAKIMSVLRDTRRFLQGLMAAKHRDRAGSRFPPSGDSVEALLHPHRWSRD